MPTPRIRKVISTFSAFILSLVGLVAVSTSASAAAISIDSLNVSLPFTKSHTSTSSPAFYYEVQAPSNGTLTVSSCNSTGGNSAVTLEKMTAGGRATGAITDVSALSQVTSSSSSTCTSNDETRTYSVTSGTWYYAKVEISGNAAVSVEITFSGAVTPTYVELDRVTICHRTHATTNPYRIITVSASSIVKADGTRNGHGLHSPDARRNVEPTDPTKYGVYDSTRTYKPSEKLWEDIIPPFKDKATGGIFTGLNWYWSDPTATAGAGGQVFDKTAFGTVTTLANNASSNTVAQAAIDACKGASGNLTARQFFDLERKNLKGKPEDVRKEILDELKETDAFETDPANKEGDTLEKELPAREGPKNIPQNPIAQSLSGNVWLDINRNGFQENNEPDMSNIKVTVQQGTPVEATGMFTGFGTGARVLADAFGANWVTNAIDSSINRLAPAVNYIRNLFGMATTYTVYTDKAGYYLFKSLASGEWYATGTVPDGLGVTYDSSGISDATADTVVPAGGHAFTWIGLVGEASTGIKSTVKTPTGSLATSDVVLTFIGPDGKFCSDDDVNYVLTPTNGVIEMSGIPAGKYYVRQIGSTGTIADVTITSGQIYTTEIKTTAGVRCAVLTESELTLAATGANVDSKAATALVLLVVGTMATFVGVRRNRFSKTS